MVSIAEMPEITLPTSREPARADSESSRPSAA